MGSTRSSALVQIMQIEDQVHRIVNGKKYKKMNQYIRALTDYSGHSIVKVENPDEEGKMIELRKNSKEARECLKTYKDMLNEYDVLLRELSIRKRSLKSELFG
jgi:hypothetical protein